MTDPDWNMSWGDDTTNKSPSYNPPTQPTHRNPYYSAQESMTRDGYYHNNHNNWDPNFQQPPQQQPPPYYPNAASNTIPQQNYFSSPNANNFQMFPAEIMNEPMINTAQFAAHVGGQFAEQQKEKDWVNKLGQNGQPMDAKMDLNAPDLYIPLMSFITYVLVSGFVFGLQKRFSPEKLGILTTNALFYLLLENILVFLTKYILNISHALNIWQALSYSSYKFAGFDCKLLKEIFRMTFCLVLYLIGGLNIYYVGLMYCIFSTLRSLKTFFLDVSGYSNEGGRKRKLYLLLSITVVQALIMWLLTSSVTTHNIPEKYNFAKMALSGMGAISNKNLPIQEDGEVDYEALLKMP